MRCILSFLNQLQFDPVLFPGTIEQSSDISWIELDPLNERVDCLEYGFVEFVWQGRWQGDLTSVAYCDDAVIFATDPEPELHGFRLLPG